MKRARDYNEYVESDVDHKEDVNDILIFFATKVSSVNGVIIVDGRNQNTTRKLLESGLVKGCQIHIPEIDPKTHKIHKASGLANSYHCKLEDFLQANPDILKTVNVVFFDTMGMPEGNYTKQLFPMENLKMYLEACREKKIVVCLTFCLRSKGKFSDRETMIEQIEEDYVFPCIAWCQYKVVSYLPIKYHRNFSDNRKTQEMLFMAFELEKDTSIKRSFIEFPTKEITIDGERQKVFSGYAPKYYFD